MTISSFEARGGTLGAYSRDVGSVAILDAKQEATFAAAYRAGDRMAGEKIVLSCLPYVIKVARKHACLELPLEDLIQEGNIGLLRALPKFDPARGRFISYARDWVRAMILLALKTKKRTVRSTTEVERLLLRIARLNAVTFAQHGREATDAEILAHTEMLPARLEDIRGYDALHCVPFDTLADGTAVDALEAIIEEESRQEVRRAIAAIYPHLTPACRAIVEHRFLADEPTSYADLGQAFGVSRPTMQNWDARLRERLAKVLQ